MRYEIHNRPTYASLHVFPEPGEEVITEAGAMMSMSPHLSVQTSLAGGVTGAFNRWLSGESLFLNTYKAEQPGQRLDIAPPQPGDVAHVALTGGAVVCQQGSYCASTPGVMINAKWSGFQGLFSGEGLVMIKCSGVGDLWLSSYGAIQEVQVSGQAIVDTGHIVAFEESLSWFPKPVGGVKSMLYSGEGLVMQFTGHGRLWVQTRCAEHFAEFLHPYRRRKALWKRYLAVINPFQWQIFSGRRRTG